MFDKLKALFFQPRVNELIRYVFVGGCTTLINFFMLWLLFYQIGLDYNTANALAIISSIVFAFFANKLIVFRSHVRGAPAMIREALTFFGSRGLTMLLEWGSLYYIHSVLMVDEYRWGMVTKVCINVVVLVLNYLLSRLVVFRKKSD